MFTYVEKAGYIYFTNIDSEYHLVYKTISDT